jgi:FdhD protein
VSSQADSGALEPWPTALVVDGRSQELPDSVVVEEPLEIHVAVGAEAPCEPLTVTMRTPGDDEELTLGLLYSEGLIERNQDVLSVSRPPRDPDPISAGNQIQVRLREGHSLDTAQTRRTFLSTAACGVCGKTAIESIFLRGLPVLAAGRPALSHEVLESLPEQMRSAQRLFGKTGGIHGAALFDGEGNVLEVREDVGRHNAVDKVVGASLRANRLPLVDSVLVVSGRAGFEITQKAARAAIPILAAVGAPSSLSLRLAERAGMTLVGFLRRGRFNVYTGRERIRD